MGTQALYPSDASRTFTEQAQPLVPKPPTSMRAPRTRTPCSVPQQQFRGLLRQLHHGFVGGAVMFAFAGMTVVAAMTATHHRPRGRPPPVCHALVGNVMTWRPPWAPA